MTGSQLFDTAFVFSAVTAILSADTSAEVPQEGTMVKAFGRGNEEGRTPSTV